MKIIEYSDKRSYLMKLATDQIGGEYCLDIISRLRKLGHEEVYHQFSFIKQCKAITFWFNDCVIAVLPRGGKKYQNILHYKADFYNELYVKDNNSSKDNLNSFDWDQYLIDLRKPTFTY